jgi:hypothetical protein
MEIFNSIEEAKEAFLQAFPQISQDTDLNIV